MSPVEASFGNAVLELVHVLVPASPEDRSNGTNEAVTTPFEAVAEPLDDRSDRGASGDG